MSRADGSAIISVLWLIASSLEVSTGFAIACSAMFVVYSLRAAYFTFADRKPKP